MAFLRRPQRGEAPLSPGPTDRPAAPSWLGAAALLLWPTLLALDSIVALLLGWRPAPRTNIALATALLLPCLTVGALSAGVSGRRLLQRQTTRITAAIFAATAAMALAEAAARPLAELAGSDLWHSRGLGVERRFSADPRMMRGLSGVSTYTTDDDGVRAVSPPAAHRLLCIGGSATECTYLDDRETWPHLLGDHLSAGRGEATWVGNLGISGYTTVEHLELLASLARRRRVEGIIFLVGVNDFLRHLAAADEGWPRPLWRRSRLLVHALGRRRGALLSRLLHLEEDPTGANLVPRRTARQAGLSSRPLPDLAPGLAAYAGRLRAIAAHCRAQRLRCVLVTHPVLWATDLAPADEATLWLGRDATGAYLPASELRRGMDRYNALLLHTRAAEGLLCIDLAGHMNGISAYFYDDCHFTESGARMVAATLARRLVEPLSASGGRGC